MDQCAAKSGSAASGRRSARSMPARSASSIRAAKSRASIQARSADLGAPPSPFIARIKAANAARRRIGSTAGGRSRAPSSVRGASSSAPSAVIRGNNSGRPLDTRRNDSARARAARRVGRRISPWLMASGSSHSCGVRSLVRPLAVVLPPASQNVANASRKGTCGGMLKRFSAAAIARRRSPAPPESVRLPANPVGWRDETKRHRAPRPAADRPATLDPRRGSC